MKLTLLATLTTLFLTGLAVEKTPTLTGDNATVVVINNAPEAPTAGANALTKRAPPETIILANCDPSSTFGSYFFYYAAGHATSGAPDDQCIVQGGSFVTWEGRSISCTFSDTGVTFTSSIEANAQSQPNFSIVGSGFNNFRSYTCRKDDKHVLWSGSGFSCKTIYYCQ